MYQSGIYNILGSNQVWLRREKPSFGASFYQTPISVLHKPVPAG